MHALVLLPRWRRLPACLATKKRPLAEPLTQLRHAARGPGSPLIARLRLARKRPAFAAARPRTGTCPTTYAPAHAMYAPTAAPQMAAAPRPARTSYYYAPAATVSTCPNGTCPRR